MIPSAHGTITMPSFTDGGSVTLTNGSDIAVGNATTAANLKVGDYFVMTGLPFQYRCLSTPDGSFNFKINTTASATVTKQAWVIAVPVDQPTLDLIYKQNDAGNTAGRAAHNADADGTFYLDTQAGAIYERNGPSGTWTDASNTVVVWVSTTGNDTDDIATQLLTVQAAIDRLVEAGDLTGWTVIIALKAGTYNQTLNLKDVDGDPASITIMGEASLTGTPSASSYTISSSTVDAVRAVGLSSVWTLDGFTVSTTKGHSLYAKNSRLRFNQLRFGASAGSHLAAAGGGVIVLSGDGYTISGGGNAHMNANGSGAVIDLQAEASARPTITISAAVTFSTAFAWARAAGQIFTGTGLTFTNKTNVTGRRWRAEQNSAIDSGQSGEKYLPGTLAGVAVKSGEYL